jgi:uncharacterized protein
VQPPSARRPFDRQDVTDTARSTETLTVAITGATGLIGRPLVASLVADGHVVRRITRSPREPGDFAWDPNAGRLDPRALDGADAVVHLAGENIADRWTSARKVEIRRSRELGTRLVAESIARTDPRPRVLVSSSAIGYYGDRGDELLDESSAPGDGFLADVCRVWEAATMPAADAGVRVVCARTGLVLTPRGGLLERLLLPFRLGLGGRLGDGRAWMSCIALDELVGAIRHAIATDALRGPANVVGPVPVTNAEFTEALARVLHRPAPTFVPKFALRLLLGAQQADEMALASQRVVPTALLASGYRFRYATVEDALRAVLE